MHGTEFGISKCSGEHPRILVGDIGNCDSANVSESGHCCRGDGSCTAPAELREGGDGDDTIAGADGGDGVKSSIE